MDQELIEKLKLALSASNERLFALVREPDGEILRATLRNPALAEAHLLVLLQRRDLSEALVSKISKLEIVTSSYRLQRALGQNSAASAAILSATLPRLHLFDLLNLSRLATSGPDQRAAAQQQLIRRLPASALGQRISLARQGSGALLAELLKEPHPALTEACLGNPRLQEMALVQFLRTPRAGESCLAQVVAHPRWNCRPAVIRALLHNRKTPVHFFVRQLTRLSNSVLGTLARHHSHTLILNLIGTEKRNRGL